MDSSDSITLLEQSVQELSETSDIYSTIIELIPDISISHWCTAGTFNSSTTG